MAACENIIDVVDLQVAYVIDIVDVCEETPIPPTDGLPYILPFILA